ncbi:hypothetical protein [Streptomyces sp. NPDC054837]
MEKDVELMAVLLGEPTRGQGPDAAAGHAAAERDMAAVREHLHWIGDGLARKAPGQPTPEPETETAPDPEPASQSGRVRGRRGRRLGLFALAASVVVALLGTGTAYLLAHNGLAGDASEVVLTDEGLIACSSAVVEGTVERVEPADGNDRYRIVLDVDRHYKPTSGQRRLTFTDEGPNVPAYYRTGVRLLVLVSSLPGEGPDTYRAGDPPYPEGRTGPARDALEAGRLRVERALPAAQDISCEGGD